MKPSVTTPSAVSADQVTGSDPPWIAVSKPVTTVVSAYGLA
jgi:hypothetical protein